MRTHCVQAVGGSELVLKPVRPSRSLENLGEMPQGVKGCRENPTTGTAGALPVRWGAQETKYRSPAPQRSMRCPAEAIPSLRPTQPSSLRQ